MSGDLIQTIARLERRLAKLETQTRSADRQIDACSKNIPLLMAFPGIRAIWPLGGQNGSTQFGDVSGNGLYLSRTADVANEATAAGATLAPKSFFISGSYAWIVDNPAFEYSTSGVRSGQNARGFTVGMWVRVTSLGLQIAMSKWGASGNRSFSLSVDNGSGQNSFFVSDDGTSTVGVTNVGSPLAVNQWLFVCGRYRSEVPDLKIWMNDTSAVLSSGVPATIHNGTADFRVGQRFDGTGGFGGNGSTGFYCHAAVRDESIERYYHSVKGMFHN